MSEDNMSKEQKFPQFPPGWDEESVRDLINHYDGQSEDDQAAEIEAALAKMA
jgi:hypothetical protein